MRNEPGAERVTIVGDGQMGVVMAAMLAERGLPVTVWGPFPEPIAELARTHRSARLPELEIFTNGSLKQKRFLRDDSHLST